MTFDTQKAREDLEMHENAIEEAQSCMCGHCHECGFDPAEMKGALDEIERLRSKPAWEVTEERIEAIEYMCEWHFCTEKLQNCGKYPEDVLRAMLEEVGK